MTRFRPADYCGFELVTPTEEQIAVLYKLLVSRVHKISCSTPPCYADHESFVRNNPYRCWYLIKYLRAYVGSFYITSENTIGINIRDSVTRQITPKILTFVRDEFDPLPSILSVRDEIFSVNVPSTNRVLSDCLELIGCNVRQITYSIPN